MRPDGYHELASLMQCISLHDTVTCTRTEGVDIVLDAEARSCGCPPADNIVIGAARALARRRPAEAGAHIALTKRVPVGAGLGGGSSDAAATLLALARLWESEISHTELARLAAELGADVPFFLGGPAAFCTGMGERVREIEPRHYELVLWNPGIALSTADVYRCFDTRPRPHRTADECLAAYESGDPYALAAQVWNNLAIAAGECLPELAEMRRQCCDAGALAAWVSGSGPTVVGLCADDGAACACATRLRSQARGAAMVFHCHTLGTAVGER